jgi:hypothetical protein
MPMDHCPHRGHLAHLALRAEVTTRAKILAVISRFKRVYLFPRHFLIAGLIVTPEWIFVCMAWKGFDFNN